jgi:ArsR family transcriptional regulator
MEFVAVAEPVADDAAGLAKAAELLRALGAPHRLSIVLHLATGPHCVHELVERLGISQSLVSQHLRVLRNTGLVVGTRRGKETAYSLADEHVAHIARDAVAHGDEQVRRLSPAPTATSRVPTSRTTISRMSTG